MSINRTEMETDKFLIVFGIDEVSGTFIQIWKKPVLNKALGALVSIDNKGVLMQDSAHGQLPHGVIFYVEDLQSRYAYAKRMGNPAPSIDAATVVALMVRTGIKFPKLGLEVVEALSAGG